MNKINKKILLFTHIADIDGMGSAVLCNIIFKEVKIELCNANELDDIFLTYYNNNKLEQYDNIYITDICLSLENLKLINSSKIKDKITIIDHHPHKLKYVNNFNFLHGKLKNNNGLCCASSLFYEYCLEKDLLKQNAAIDKFIELIRRQDTWEWKTIYRDEMSNDLSILFNLLGTNAFIKNMVNKLENNQVFKFNEAEQNFIECYKEKINISVNNAFENVIYKQKDGLKVAIAFIDYEIRNYIQEKIKNANNKVDYLILISLDTNKISFRRINEKVKLNEIAQKYGGGGHEASSGATITKEMKEKIIVSILN